MNICTHMYTYAHMHTYEHTCAHICTYEHICTQMHTYEVNDSKIHICNTVWSPRAGIIGLHFLVSGIYWFGTPGQGYSLRYSET